MRRISIATAVAVTLCSSAAAGDWTITPRLSLAEIYTDNVTLAPSGNEDQELITEVSPGISAHGEGRRVKADLEYRMQNLFYANESGRNRTHHQMSAQAQSELVREHFFVDAEASASQSIISANQGLSFSNVNTGNRTDVYRFRVSPYYRHRFSSVANLLTRYTYSGTRFEDGASDSDSNAVEVDLSSGRAFGRSSWRATYNRERLERETSNDVDHESALAQAGYRITDSLSALVRGGYEEHDFRASAIRGFENGTYVAAGGSWRPNRHILLEALYGSRYRSANLHWRPTTRTSLEVQWANREVGLNPGVNWDAEFELRTRNTTWGGSYSESTVSTQQLEFLGRYINPFTGEVFQFPPPGEPVLFVPDGFFSLTDELFIRERGQLSLGLRSAKSRVSVIVFRENRRFVESGEEEKRYGTSGTWSWRFGSRTRFLLGGHWQRAKAEIGTRDEALWSVNTGLRRNISDNTDALLEYVHTERDPKTSSSTRGYTENRVMLRVNMGF